MMSSIARPVNSVLFVISIFSVAMISGCSHNDSSGSQVSEEIVARDHVHQSMLREIRLGDGAPLNIGITIRWSIDDVEQFMDLFESPDIYAESILEPRERELVMGVANTYDSIDSIFTAQREQFVQNIKATLLNGAGDEGITIKEIIFSGLEFPESYTQAMENIAMREHELEQIRLKNVIDLEKAKAEESRTAAAGQVRIIEAETEGKVAAINARTEEQRRQSALAKAETQAQVRERNARADAVKTKLMAQAEAERRAILAEVDLKQQEGMKDLEIQKQRELRQLELDQEKEIAELCASNPAYAAFIVNKELASKVQIAVVPTTGSGNLIGNMLQNTMNTESQ